MDQRTTIVLIGLRGSGKSSVARLIAARLGLRAVDLDDRSPAILGEKNAGDAIRRFGEPAFRRAELAALEAAMKETGIVLALGGGTPTAPGVEELLSGARKRGAARVVYLRASEQTLRARLARQEDNAHRPSLTGLGVLDEIGVLLNLRDTLYKSIADVVVDVDLMDAGQVVERVLGAAG